MFFQSSQSNWYHIVAAAILAGTLATGAAFASGKHSGGHGHDDDHGHGAMEFGAKGDPSEVDRTIEIVATDNAYDVETLDVKAGETIRFVIHNNGQLLHEFNIGTPDMHTEHQKEMLEMMQKGMMTPTGMKKMMDSMTRAGGKGPFGKIKALKQAKQEMADLPGMMAKMAEASTPPAPGQGKPKKGTAAMRQISKDDLKKKRKRERQNKRKGRRR